MIIVRAEEVIEEVADLCRQFQAKKVILYGSRAKGTARERSLFYDFEKAVKQLKINED